MNEKELVEFKALPDRIYTAEEKLNEILKQIEEGKDLLNEYKTLKGIEIWANKDYKNETQRKLALDEYMITDEQTIKLKQQLKQLEELKSVIITELNYHKNKFRYYRYYILYLTRNDREN